MFCSRVREQQQKMEKEEEAGSRAATQDVSHSPQLTALRAAQRQSIDAPLSSHTILTASAVLSILYTASQFQTPLRPPLVYASPPVSLPLGGRSHKPMRMPTHVLPHTSTLASGGEVMSTRFYYLPHLHSSQACRHPP